MQSSLFLRHQTVVDHGWISGTGTVHGGSFHPNFIVTGPVDEHEKVVIDFSACKKDIKAIVDDHEDGFDHHGWILNSSEYTKIEHTEGVYMHILTPECEFEGPREMFKFVNADGYMTSLTGSAMGQDITKKMRIKYPGVTVQVKNTMHAFIDKEADHSIMFRYTHGLKNSSSKGCRRPIHGHLSFLEFHGMSVDRHKAAFVGAEIQEHINEAVFIFDENIHHDGDKQIGIEYQDIDGNEYYAAYMKRSHNIIILPHETTVEYLVEYIAKKFRDQLKEARVDMIAMSEGLAKGAQVYL